MELSMPLTHRARFQECDTTPHGTVAPAAGFMRSTATAGLEYFADKPEIGNPADNADRGDMIKADKGAGTPAQKFLVVVMK